MAPISRPVVKGRKLLFLAAFAAKIISRYLLPAAALEPHPFLRLMAASASRIAPDTHQDQALGPTGACALAVLPPQKNVGAASHPKKFHRTVAAGRPAPISGWLTLRAIRCYAVTAPGDGDLASNSVQLVAAPVTVRGSPDRRRPSGKAARYVERLALPQDVVASARQLVRQRLGGNDVVGFGLLAFVETLGLGTKAPGKIRCLNEGPGEIFVAVFDVAFAFLLAIAAEHTVDAARVGRTVADLGEPVDRAGFQKNDRGKRLADARRAGQQTVLWTRLDAFLQALFQNLDPRLQCRDNGNIRLDCQAYIRLPVAGCRSYRQSAA